MNWNAFIEPKPSVAKPKAKGHWASLQAVLDEQEAHTLQHFLSESRGQVDGFQVAMATAERKA